MGIKIPHSNVPSSAADEAITKEMHDGLGRATTTTSSLAAKQGSGNITKTQTKVKPSGLSSSRTSLEGGLGCHFTIGDSPVQTRPKRLSNFLYEPLLEEERSKKQKLDEQAEVQINSDQEEDDIKKYMKIVPGEEIAINAVPLATKPPVIIDWKIISEGRSSSYHIIRANGSSKRYIPMINLL
nr:hypothetical protein [Tanacetum cinerariifolium]